MPPPQPISFLDRLRRGLWGMLLPCFGVALLSAISTFDSNNSMERVADRAVREYRALDKVREEFVDLLDIADAEQRGIRTERTFDKQVGTILSAFDEARSAVDASDVAPLWTARQHVVDLAAHTAAFEQGDLTATDFLALADADEQQTFAALAAVGDAADAEFVTDVAGVSRRSSAILVIVAGLVLAAIVGTFLLIRHLRRALYEPLRDLEHGLGRFAVDGLAHRIEVDGDREFRSVAAVVNEMAEQLEQSLAELAHKAFHDSLTGLANRAKLEQRLEHHLRSPTGDAAGRAGAVVVIDLDGFKAVNDALGHEAGDAVLVEVARRLELAVRPADLVARMGGDEFAVLLAEARDRDDVDSIVERLAAAIARPIMVAGRAHVLRCSAGAQLIGSAATPLDLLRHADIALYAAKREGRGRMLQFEPTMEVVVQQRLALEADLRIALGSGQIEVVYQPVIDLADRRVAGLEALARWNHPVRGVVLPDEFIPIAEATGLIVPLGRVVLETACRQLAEWRRLPDREGLKIGVNVSPNQLQDRDFVEHVRAALSSSTLPPAALMLEVTETLMTDPHAVECLHELKQLGIGVALDDFGTGYSSLSYLQQLPIDVLKIDKSFIDGIDTHPERAVLVNTVLRMARALRLRTIAEGIEDAGQLELLQRLGCDAGQGYFLSRPLAVDAVGAVLGRHPSAAAAPARRESTNDLVAVRVGPVPTAAVVASLDHAEQLLALCAAPMRFPFDVSPGVTSLMRHYIDEWRIGTLAGPVFEWEGVERVSVLRLLSIEWARVSDEAATYEGLPRPPESEPFRNALTHGVLVALAEHEMDRPAGAPVRRQPPDPRRPHELAPA